MLRHLAAAVCVALLLHDASALTIIGEPASDEARVIVKFKAPSAMLAARDAPSRAVALGQRIGVPLRAGVAVSELAQVVFAGGMTSEALAQRLAQQGDVEYAVPDRRRRIMAAPNDPLYAGGVPGNGPAAGQWYLRPNVGAVKSAIDVEPAWSVTNGYPQIVVAVLDTGVRFEHPDNRAVTAGGNLLAGYDMVSGVASANDGDGRDADASDPGDWLTQAEISEPGSPFYRCVGAPRRSSWHGTQTSGLIAALTDNQMGMASVGREVRILPVRVLGKCGGTDSDIIAGMRWAAGLPVPGVPANPESAGVINMSLGGEGPCEAPYVDVVNELASLGIPVVASAGNAAGHAVGAPGNCPGVIAVGALRHVGQKVGFSNLGPEVAISAPGGNCVNTAAGTPCLYPILTTTNTGATVPVASSYTDSFNISVGTSFAAPLVAGTLALMRSVNSALKPAQLRAFLQATARPFPTTGGEPSDPVCTAPQYSPEGAPVEQLQCYCTTATCGAGMLDAGTAVQAAATAIGFAGYQTQGLWWNDPPGSESGWGLNIALQGDVLFATWFTYDSSGAPWWLSATMYRLGPNIYEGPLVETRGPPFNAVPFDPAQVTTKYPGGATLVFGSNDRGLFAYTINGVSQQKNIARQVYGTVPTCVFGLHPPQAFATNYQDLWWAAPAGVESGWGINLTMQSDIIFATWFTYDQSGAPMWLSGTATNAAPGVYTGPLNRTTGPAHNAVPFDPAAVQAAQVGNYTLTFSDGSNATFAYTVNGIAQTKNITRQVFRAPGTVCSEDF